MKPIAFEIGPRAAEQAWRKLKQFSPPLSRSLFVGEVQGGPTVSEDAAKTACPEVFEELHCTGYKVARRHALYHHPGIDITLAHGNVGVHQDDAFGKIALILLDLKPFCRSQTCQFDHSPFETESYLWTKYGLNSMGIGSGIVFDTDKDHAWFSPGVATFLSVAVTKTSKAKIGLS